MSARWRMAVRGLWQERTRATLVVVAIALGIAGFTAVLASYAILIRELDRGYLETNPASATLRTDAVDRDLVAAVLATGWVSDAEPRRTITGRLKAGPGQWRNLTLFVVEDYANIRIGKLVPEQGAWPPGPGEMLIERDAFQVARAKIGDTVRVKTVGGDETTLRVAGGVHDVGQAQARMENVVYGYVTLATLAALGEEPFLDQLQILVAEDRFDEDHVRHVAAEVKKLVEERGHPVRRLDVPRPGKHPHADLTGTLLLAMASFGLFVLLLSGILVINLVSARMAAQVRGIGIMKAIGATRAQIARHYLGQSLLLGGAAVVVALPFGLWGSRVLCRALGVFLNFDIESFAVPPWVLLLVAVAGLVVPLGAAAIPVWRGSRISVREALADCGVARQVFGASAFDRLLAGVGGAARPILLSVRNGFRRRTRLVLTLITLAAGGVFFLTALNVRGSLIHTLDALFAARKSDLSLSLGTMQSFEKVERAMRATPGVVRGEGWIVTEGALASETDAPAPDRGSSPHGGGMGGLHGGGGGGGLGPDRFAVIALAPETDLLQPNIVEGRWLAPDDDDTVVLNSALAARAPSAKVGGTIALRLGPSQSPWRVVGISREPFAPPQAYVPRRFFDERGGHAGTANTVRLVLEHTDAASIEAVKAGIDQHLEEQGVRLFAATSKADSRYGFDQHMLMISVFLIVVSGVLAVVGGLGLMTTMSLNVLERRRELGVLRAIGASPRMIVLLIVTEGIVIAVLSFALAALVAWPTSRALGDLIVSPLFQGGLDFAFEQRGLWLWLAICTVLGAAASILPAWHATRGPVRDAIA